MLFKGYKGKYQETLLKVQVEFTLTRKGGKTENGKTKS